MSRWAARLAQAVAGAARAHAQAAIDAVKPVSQVSLVPVPPAFRECDIRAETTGLSARPAGVRALQRVETQERHWSTTLETLETPVSQVSLAPVLGAFPGQGSRQSALKDNVDALSERWLVQFEDRTSVTVTCCPGVRRNEIFNLYPDAIAVDVADPPLPLRLPRDVSRMLDACIGAGLCGQDDRAIVTAIVAADESAMRTLIEAMGNPIGRCARCTHHTRPGLADFGYCSVRGDLPPAYGSLHPLRVLPADGGATCREWTES